MRNGESYCSRTVLFVVNLALRFLLLYSYEFVSIFCLEGADPMEWQFVYFLLWCIAYSGELFLLEEVFFVHSVALIFSVFMCS